MHIIVIGCGKVGSNLATVLSEEGHDVVIVDNDRNAFELLGSDFRGISIAGVPIDQDVLKQAGIQTADALAAVTPDDNVNIMTCQVAREIFKVRRVIARIYNPAREQVFHQFGLETICPTNISVDVIRSTLLGESGTSSHAIGNNRFEFKHEKVRKQYVGKKIVSIKMKDGMKLFGYIRGGKFEFADTQAVIEIDDVLVVAEKI